MIQDYGERQIIMDVDDSEERVLRLQRSLQKFIDTVDNLDLEDDPSGDGFTREFRVLRELGLQMREDNTHPAEEGRKPHNLKKNRYKDILPYDESRVKLDEIDGEPGSGYINANFIRGNNGYNTYIATQGPLPATVNDFWRMIWQYEVKVITMACRLVELGKRKCEQYWPSEVDETQSFGDVAVTLKSEEDFAEHCTKRVLSVSKGGGESRTVTQFQYSGWPDHDIPDDIEDILEMMAMIRNLRAQDPNVPVVIHCSAGCGRTGTICAIDFAWDVLKSGRLTEEFNLYNIIKEMREQRQSMIQAPEQYKCAHVAIKILFEKHQQLMEDHIYGNIELEDEEDSGYADPKSLAKPVPTRKVSAMVDDIESTLKYLTEGGQAYENVIVDPTPPLIPMPAAPISPPIQTLAPIDQAPSIRTFAPVVQAPPIPKAQALPTFKAPLPPVKAEHATKPVHTEPDNKPATNLTATKPAPLTKKPSSDISPPSKDKPPSPSVAHTVFAIEKIENIPATQGHPAHTQGHPAHTQGHPAHTQGIPNKRSSVRAKTSVFETNNNVAPVAVKTTAPVAVKTTAPVAVKTTAPKTTAPIHDRPVLHRVESKQNENKKFTTVISIGGAQKSVAGGQSTQKPVLAQTVSHPVKGSSTAQHHPINKSQTLPNKGLPAFYEAPQSSVPPSTLTQAPDSVYSFAGDPESSGAYSSLSTYSSVGRPGHPAMMQTGVDVVAPDAVAPVLYNGVSEVRSSTGQSAAELYAVVDKPQAAAPKMSENVYESVSVGETKGPPPVPDRNYNEEEEKPSVSDKPGRFNSSFVSSLNSKVFNKGGSSDQINTMGIKGKLDTIKQIFSGGRGAGSGSSSAGDVPADKKLLASNAKLPPKYRFDDVKYQSQRCKAQDSMYKGLPLVPPPPPPRDLDHLREVVDHVDSRSSPGKELPTKRHKHERLNERLELSASLNFDKGHALQHQQRNAGAVTPTQMRQSSPEPYRNGDSSSVEGYPTHHQLLSSRGSMRTPPSHPPPRYPHHLDLHSHHEGPLNLSLTNTSSSNNNGNTNGSQSPTQSRPSVITCANLMSSGDKYETSSNASSSYTARKETSDICDPAIEEHFRRSLGKNYSSFMSKHPSVTPSPPPPVAPAPHAAPTPQQLPSPAVAAPPQSSSPPERSPPRVTVPSLVVSTVNANVSITGSVDDHFARALGDSTWSALKAKNDPQEAPAPGSVDDHFAKALGDTWLRIKAERESPRGPPPPFPLPPYSQAHQLTHQIPHSQPHQIPHSHQIPHTHSHTRSLAHPIPQRPSSPSSKGHSTSLLST